MKFRKEIIIFSLILIFMLMSAVSAEENITIDDGADSTSNYVELDSNQGYNENNISENPILDDDVMDDDENSSEESTEQDNYNDSLDGHDASVGNGLKEVAYDYTSSNMNMAVHKSSSASHFSGGDGASLDYGVKGVSYDCTSSDMGMAVHKSSSASHSSESDGASLDYGFEGAAYDCTSSDMDMTVYKSSSASHSSEGDGADVRDNEGSINGMFSNFQFTDVINVEALKDIIEDIHTEGLFAESYSSFAEYYSNYSDYGFNQFVDLIINSYDLNNVMGLFICHDSNISHMMFIQDKMSLMNQTFDLNAISDVSVNSSDMESDLQLSDEVGCWSDPHDNSDKTGVIRSFEFSQRINCLSSNISEDIQHTFYHRVGCECTNTSFTKQHNSYDNIPKISEFDTIASAEQEDNHDCVLFKKYNVNSPFILETTSIFALFGVIEITIP